MNNVGVAELVDVRDLKSLSLGCEGSSPVSDNRRNRDRRGTINIQRQAI